MALDFAMRHPVQHLILISVFTTLREEAATMVGRPLSHLLVENYDNRAALRKLARRSQLPRIDIFHGTDDDTIPIRMGRELAEDFPALVTFYPVVVGDHASVIDKASPEIVSAMNE
jgi:predicted esterase